MVRFGALEIIVVLVFGATFILGSLGAALYLYRRKKAKAKQFFEQSDIVNNDDSNKPF